MASGIQPSLCTSALQSYPKVLLHPVQTYLKCYLPPVLTLLVIVLSVNIAYWSYTVIVACSYALGDRSDHRAGTGWSFSVIKSLVRPPSSGLHPHQIDLGLVSGGERLWHLLPPKTFWSWQGSRSLSYSVVVRGKFLCFYPMIQRIISQHW